jgi:excisionase family DNA binding protein
MSTNTLAAAVMTLTEAAEMLRVSPDTLRREIRSGHIHAKRIGQRRLVIPADSITAYLHEEKAR